MIVEIPYPYEASFVRRRCRNEEVAQLVGRMPVEVRETAAGDAPAGFRISYEGAMPDQDIRIFEDACWWPLRGSARDEGDVAFDAWRRSVENGGYLYDKVLRLAMAPASKHYPTWPTRRADDLMIKEYKWSSREATEAMVHRRLQDVMACGGRVYVRGVEPCYVIASLARSLMLTVREGFEEFASASAMKNFFRADRFEDAVSAMQGRARGGGGRVQVESRIEVLDRSFPLRLDPDVRQLKNGLNELAGWVARSYLADVRKNTSKLRDQLALVRAGLSSPAPASAIAPARAVIARLLDGKAPAGEAAVKFIGLAEEAMARAEKAVADGLMAPPVRISGSLDEADEMAIQRLGH